MFVLKTAIMIQYLFLGCTSNSLLFPRWRSKIMNLKHECGKCYTNREFGQRKFCEKNIRLLSYAKNCSTKGARWDYYIDGPKRARDKLINGRMTIKVPAMNSSTTNLFSSGFRHKICFVFHYNIAHEISGNFIDGYLQGQTIVKFGDGVVMIGFADYSVLGPNIRYIQSANNRIINVTSVNESTRSIISR